MTRFVKFSLCCGAILLFSSRLAMAEKAPLSTEELEATATHIVVGKVQAVYSYDQVPRGNYLYRRFVAEVEIEELEKGKGPAELIYVRYFTIGWKGIDFPPPGPSGHKNRPHAGDKCRFYLAQKAYDGFSPEASNSDGGYNVIYGNGIEILKVPTKRDMP